MPFNSISLHLCCLRVCAVLVFSYQQNTDCFALCISMTPVLRPSANSFSTLSLSRSQPAQGVFLFSFPSLSFVFNLSHFFGHIHFLLFVFVVLSLILQHLFHCFECVVCGGGSSGGIALNIFVFVFVIAIFQARFFPYFSLDPSAKFEGLKECASCNSGGRSNRKDVVFA